MKRGVLLALVLMLSIISTPAVLAADTLIKSGWYFSGDSFKVGTDTLSVSHLRLEDDKIYLTVNSKSLVINLEECKTLDEKKYCFEDIYRNVNAATTTDHIKFDGLDVYAGLNIGIYSIKNEITVTRAFSKTSPELEEEVEVILTVKNPSDVPITNFVYIDEYPEGVYITSATSSVQTYLKSVKIESKLNPISELTFKYRFKIKDYLAFKSTATYQYDAGAGLKKANTTTVSIDLTSKKPYSIDVKIAKASIETGEDTLATVTIKNLKSDDLEVESVEITAPPKDVSISSKTLALKQNGPVLSWSGELKNGSTQILEFSVKASKSGKYGIPVLLKIKQANGVYYTSLKNVSFSAAFKQPEIILSIKDPSVYEGSSFRYALSIKNPNVYTYFKNINGIVRSNISSEESGFSEEISPGQTKTILIKENIIGPSVLKETDFPFSANGRFDTFFGEFGNFTKTASVKILPINKSVFITKKLDKTTILKPKENLTITVTAKSSLAQNIDVHVNEVISNDIEIIGGIIKADLKFTAASEKQAYIYTIRVPEDYSSKEIALTTYFKIEGEERLLNHTTIVFVNVTVVPPIQKINTSTEELTPEEIAEIKAEEERKAEERRAAEKGTFTKIVDGVTDFFKRIFGSS